MDCRHLHGLNLVKSAEVAPQSVMNMNKSQIPKLENHTNNATIETILKVFSALKTDVHFNVQFEDRPVQLI